MDVTTGDVSQPCANRRMRPLSGHFSNRLLKCKFEANSRIKLEHIVDEGRCYFVHEQPEYVNMRPHIDKGDFGSFSVCDSAGRVECNPVPDQLGSSLRIVVRQQDTTGSVGSIDFKPVIGAVIFSQAEIVQQRRELYNLTVVGQTAFLA